MLHNNVPTSIDSSGHFLIQAIEAFSGHKGVGWLLLIVLSLIGLACWIADAWSSIERLKILSGSHPMLSKLPIEDLQQAIVELKSEPTPLKKLFVVVNFSGLTRPFIYFGMMSLALSAFMLQFLLKDTSTSVNAKTLGCENPWNGNV